MASGKRASAPITYRPNVKPIGPIVSIPVFCAINVAPQNKAAQHMASAFEKAAEIIRETYKDKEDK